MNTAIELDRHRARKRAQAAIAGIEAQGLAVTIVSDQGSKFDVVIYDPDDYETDPDWINADNSMRCVVDGSILLAGDSTN